MRHLSMTHPKTGQVCRVSLETVPPRRLEVEPFPLIGIEAELSLRHEESMAPASSGVMLPLFGAESWRTAEIAASCCEIKTDPYRLAGELLAQYRERVSWLCRWAETRALQIIPLATDPLELRGELSAYGFIRKIVAEKYGTAAMELCRTDCTQININVPDGDALIALFRGMVRLGPVLAGMLAASPFSSGRPAGVMAFRHVLRRCLLNGGDPEVLPADLRWEEYVISHQALTQMGMWMSTAYATNGLIRIRPDRMCVEIGAADLIAMPDHLAGIVALLRRVAYRILSAYRDGEPLPSWFGTDAPAIQDMAFRTGMLSAVKLGSAGSCYTQAGRPAVIRDIFEQLVQWAEDSMLPDDSSLPWRQAVHGLHDLLNQGSPAERMLRSFHALHSDCADPLNGCPGCSPAVADVCRQWSRSFHSAFNTTSDSSALGEPAASSLASSEIENSTVLNPDRGT